MGDKYAEFEILFAIINDYHKEYNLSMNDIKIGMQKYVDDGIVDIDGLHKYISDIYLLITRDGKIENILSK